MGMLHCFMNDDGEVIAADTAEQAGRYHDIELGGHAEIQGTWRQMPDDKEWKVDDEEDGVQTKTCSEWAAEHETPGYVSTTYT
jgi:hypothetical protein